MKQICRHCGQDTYSVDIEYLVGHDHLSCALEAETKSQKMEIVGWKKLDTEKIIILGAQFYISDCIENIKEYSATLYNAVTFEKVFNITLRKSIKEFELRITVSDLSMSGIQRMVKKNELKSLNVFLSLVCSEITGNKIFNSYTKLVGDLQDEQRKKTKLKTTTGNINFNMPVSQSIQW